MSAPYKEVQQILDNKLADIADLPTIITENDHGFLAQTDETSPLYEKYIRTSIIPRTTRDLTIGIGGCDDFGGIFNVEIFTPVGNGYLESLHWVDEVVEQFPKTTTLTDGTFNVHILQYSRGPSLVNDNYHQINVFIEWSCFVQRS